MDESRFYALLRFEEASLALRAALRLELVERMDGRVLDLPQLNDLFKFTPQSGRTFFCLLHVMGILDLAEDGYGVSTVAASCLTKGLKTSREPYLAMGSTEAADALIDLMRGNHSAEDQPLYGTDSSGPTLMDVEPVAREVSLGLASRARNFAGPLSKSIARVAGSPNTLADIGAGSPYVSNACVETMPTIEKAILVDRANGMQFAREIAKEEGFDLNHLEFCESDFFEAVPPADVYVLSNTAHDWLVEEYRRIVDNIGDVITDKGLICIHEPILSTEWNSEVEWIHALWMACYALTLLRLTLGKGTCYTLKEHCEILSECGFEQVDHPAGTSDGCTALFFRRP